MEHDFDAQIETFRGLRERDHVASDTNQQKMFLDLSKAKQLQGAIAKAISEEKKVKPSLKIQELEDRNTRLIELVQKVVDENKSMHDKFRLLKRSFDQSLEYNKKLCFIASNLQDKFEKTVENSIRQAKVYKFFKEMQACSSSSDATFSIEARIFSQLVQGIEQFKHPLVEEDEEVFRQMMPIKDCRTFSALHTI